MTLCMFDLDPQEIPWGSGARFTGARDLRLSLAQLCRGFLLERERDPPAAELFLTAFLREVCEAEND